MIYKMMHWPEKHPRVVRLFNILALAINFLNFFTSSWQHDTHNLLVSLLCLASILWAIHSKDNGGDDGDDSEDDDPDMPTGDAIDRWLRGRTNKPQNANTRRLEHPGLSA